MQMKATTSFENKTELVRAENRMPRWVLPAVRVAMFVVDIILAKLCFVGAFVLRGEGAIFQPGTWQLSGEFAPYAAVLYLAIPIRLAMLLYQQVYRLSGAFTYTEEAVKIFKAVS